MDLRALWDEASSYDPTLRMRDADFRALRRKRVAPEPYSRATLFARMAATTPAVFTGFPLPLRAPPEELPRAVANGFPAAQRARVQRGPLRRRSRIKVPELIRLWRNPRALVSTTDLHFRGTRFGRLVDVTQLALEPINLLIRGSEEMRGEETMTLVVSSRGNVTDSHSDDPDGSNHCFLGRKLWLAWETFEGKARGLEDDSRDNCRGRAAFDMRTFLDLPSARWWLVSPGETLFLPSRLTHKVITLEPYIGIGSYHVVLPSAFQTIARWHTHGSLWSLPDGGHPELVDDITRHTATAVRKLRRASRATQERWGLPLFDAAVARWKRRANHAPLAHASFAELVSC